MRMFDKLIRQKTFAFPKRVFDSAYIQTRKSEIYEQYDFVRDHLKTCPKIICDNVADYMFRISEKDIWSDEEDFPNVAPPFDIFWMEMRIPSIINTPQGAENVHRRANAGFLFTVKKTEEGFQYSALGFQGLDKESSQVAGPVGQLFFRCDKEGKLILEYNYHTLMCPEESFNDPAIYQFMKDLKGVLEPCWLALSFMHCKNVKVEDFVHPEKLQKKREKHRGFRLMDYKIINIEPFKAVQKRVQDEHHVSAKRAFHLCRGHFATYNEDNPLFGKITGRFWIPPHTRGNIKYGTIKKDYNVKAPGAGI